MQRSGAWIKVVMFLIGIVMLAGVTSVLLDPGLGSPDDERRGHHPAGFSVAIPRGWGASSYPQTEDGDLLRITPERVTGRSTIIAVSKLRGSPVFDPAATHGAFQGQPANFFTKQRRYSWYWTVQFQRENSWYEIVVASPIQIDVLHSPLMPFIDSFRLEATITPVTRPAVTTPATMPAMGPVLPG